MGNHRRCQCGGKLLAGLLASGCGGGVVEASSYSASSTGAEGSDDGPSSATVDDTVSASASASASDTTSASVTDASAEDPSDDDSSAGDSVGTDDVTGTTDATGSEGEGSTTESCIATDELCDTVDNDCDGVIDEGSPANPACTNCLFLLSADGASYFAICAGFVTWDAARTECATFGGDLAIIDDAVDQNAIMALLLGDTWIGLSDSAEEGHWIWVDGSDSIADGVPVGYDGWAATQPEGGAENCGEFDPAQSGWADAGCDQLQPYICRHPL